MGVNPGSPGFSIPDDESTQVRKLRDQERTTRENAAARTLEASQIGKGGLRVTDGGSITVEAPGTIDLSSGTFSAANVNATNVNATNVTAGGTVQGGAVVSTSNVTANGTVNGVAGLTSVGAYNNDITVLPGSRHTMWQHSGGSIGYAPSTRVKKTNIRDVPFTAEQVRACTPGMFSYIAQVEIRDNPENEFYDPTYKVPTEAGLFAEDLIKHGLEVFVLYEDDGVTPAGVDYAGFGAVANLVAVRDLDARLARLEAAQP